MISVFANFFPEKRSAIGKVPGIEVFGKSQKPGRLM
jgi:hypothetical protein